MIYSIFLILLMKKLRWRDVKGFAQSHQILCDRLGARTHNRVLQKVLGITIGVH